MKDSKSWNIIWVLLKSITYHVNRDLEILDTPCLGGSCRGQMCSLRVLQVVVAGGAVLLAFVVTNDSSVLGPALAPGQWALWARLASWRCCGVYGRHDGTHHDVHTEWRNPSWWFRFRTGFQGLWHWWRWVLRLLAQWGSLFWCFVSAILVWGRAQVSCSLKSHGCPTWLIGSDTFEITLAEVLSILLS